VAEQPSSAARLPSSHSSPGSTTPLPHAGPVATMQTSSTVQPPNVPIESVSSANVTATASFAIAGVRSTS